MFGYVIPDKPNMFVKDYYVYKAYYCGLCKSIGHDCSQCMRFMTNYDVTFLSILVHGVLGQEVVVKKEGCILSPKKKPIVKYNPLMRRIVDVNSMLAHYKCVDDIRDNKSGAKKFLDTTMIRRHFNRAVKREPEIANIMETNFRLQAELEAEGNASIDRVADPFAVILREVTRVLTGEKYNQDLGDMMYDIGRLVYIMDAIDDVEEDSKNKEYNPMLVGYEFTTIDKFHEDRGEELKFLLYTSYNAIKSHYKGVVLESNEGVVTNIIWYGLYARIEEILGRTCKCKRTRI